METSSDGYPVMPARWEAIGEQQPLAQEQSQKPNVLFILTDDQAPEDLANMTNVQSLLTVVQATAVRHVATGRRGVRRRAVG
jgi:hypothetical protein